MVQLMRNKKLCDECEAGQQGAPLKDKIWDEQRGHREIILNGPIDDSIVEKVVIQIQNINKVDSEQEKEFEKHKLSGFEREPITIFITSPGGGVGHSFAAVSAIEASVTPVITVAVGEAMSGGFLVLLAGHKRYAQRYATLMYHELSSATGGKSTEIQEYGAYLDTLQHRISDYVVSNSLITEDQILDCHIRKTDWYMNTAEALELGVVDGIWPPEVYVLDEEEECGCDCEDCTCEESE